MKQYFINKDSENLIMFFTGWGCDEYEFAHLDTNSSLLLLYDYSDLNLNLNFDFSKYKQIDLIAFSAGVFVASIMDFDFLINKKIALSGNPYLFDEQLGLSKDIQNILYNITVDDADNFAKNFLIKTDEEWAHFHHSNRTPESCKVEFDCLKKIYNINKQKITDIYDSAIIGQDDPIFNVSTQKEYYGNRLKIVENARHNLFFRINNYEQIFMPG